MPLLEVENLQVSYGAIHALHGVSLSVEEGEIATLVGSNGAGKTTLLKTISGLLRPRAGAIRFRGKPIAGAPPHHIVSAGISHSPEGRQVFANLSVRENLLLGAYQKRNKQQIQDDEERGYALFPILKERMHQKSGTLSGGEQQMLAMARALMARPALLLLDEPSLGLAPLIVRKIFTIIKDINTQSGTTIFLVEQNANMALSTAHRGYVMQTGAITMQDKATTLLADPAVKAAYLGH